MDVFQWKWMMVSDYFLFSFAFNFSKHANYTSSSHQNAAAIVKMYAGNMRVSVYVRLSGPILFLKIQNKWIKTSKVFMKLLMEKLWKNNINNCANDNNNSISKHKNRKKARKKSDLMMAMMRAKRIAGWNCVQPNNKCVARVHHLCWRLQFMIFLLLCTTRSVFVWESEGDRFNQWVSSIQWMENEVDEW